MSLVTLVLLLAATSLTLTRSQDPEVSATSIDANPQLPIKLDKNLRRALLKALTDLEAESAEQHKDESDTIIQRDTSAFEGVATKGLSNDLGIQKTAYSFKSFPGDDDLTAEDKLQNSSFVEAVRYVTLKTPAMNIEKASQEDARSFHVQNVILPEKSAGNFGAKTEVKAAKTERTNAQGEAKTVERFSVNNVQSVTLKPSTEISESLAGSASSGIGSANALVGRSPSASGPGAVSAGGIAKSGVPISNALANVGGGITANGIAGSGISSNAFPTANALIGQKAKSEKASAISTSNNLTVAQSSDSKDKTEEVKIFQAPLVAAFTVQQDEQGIPKSVVPIFRSPNDAQALTLQEQLEFKQQLLEKQLAELQQQQLQQTQFLVQQQHLYEQQLRQKQRQQFYLQEQARIKQLEEQAKIKRLEEERIKQLEEQQRFKFEEQRLNRFQRPVPQKQFFFEQSNNFLTFQPPVESNVHLQPSLALEVPSVAAPQAFQPAFQQDPLRLQAFRPQQAQHHHQQSPQQVQPLQQQQQQFSLQQPQQLQQIQQPQQLAQIQQSQSLQQIQQHQTQHQAQHQQQRLQQSFASFSTEFQPPLTSTARFNRQEAFNAVGNFGFNQNPAENAKILPPGRSNFAFGTQQRTPANNFYNPFAVSSQFRQSKPPTPAKQIQHLLYQSGIAGDLNNVPGIRGHEDLNIVSKVLALNVGAVPNKSAQLGAGSTTFGKATA